MEGFYSLGPCRALFSQGNMAYIVKSIDIIETKTIEKYRANDAKRKYYDKDLAIELASEKGWLSVIRFLIKNEVDVSQNTNALAQASKNGHYEIVKLLVDNGTKANNREALRSAIIGKHINIAKFLVSRGAVINIDYEINRIVQNESANGRLDVVKFLVENGSNILEISNQAVKCATMHGHTKILRFIFEQKDYNEDMVNSLFQTACAYGRFENVKFLASKGADITADVNRAIIWASKSSDLQTVKYLVDKGVDINFNKDEAVQLASLWGNFNTVKFLVAKGADVMANNGQAMKWAVKYNRTDIANLLKLNSKEVYNISYKYLRTLYIFDLMKKI